MRMLNGLLHPRNDNTPQAKAWHISGFGGEHDYTLTATPLSATFLSWEDCTSMNATRLLYIQRHHANLNISLADWPGPGR